jgi:hypothetical protein
VTPVPPVTVRPVVHTTDVPAWLAIFRVLGARILSADPLWTELELDRGRVTLSGLVHGAQEGEVVLGFETPDLTTYVEAVNPPPGMTVEPFSTQDYTSVRVVGRDGLDFLVDTTLAGGSVRDQPAAWVRAHWITPDVERTAEDVAALGPVPRARQENASCVGFDAERGVVLVQPSDGASAGVDISVEVRDVGAIRRLLADAGIAFETATGDRGEELRIPFPGRGDLFLAVVPSAAEEGP